MNWSKFYKLLLERAMNNEKLEMSALTSGMDCGKWAYEQGTIDALKSQDYLDQINAAKADGFQNSINALRRQAQLAMTTDEHRFYALMSVVSYLESERDTILEASL